MWQGFKLVSASSHTYCQVLQTLKEMTVRLLSWHNTHDVYVNVYGIIGVMLMYRHCTNIAYTCTGGAQGL